MLFAKVLSLVLLATLSSAYTIQSGDTYCLIAQKYGCSDWTVLKSLNGYPETGLPVGGYMNIPSSCTGYQTCYNAQVQPGDTYTSIAARYNIDATCLSNTNCNGGLYAYGTICIPTNCKATSQVTQSPYGNYVIKSGDTYCQIAQKYGCSDWTVLQKYNQYPVYALPVGGSMTIPSSPQCTGYQTCYNVQVQPGDSYTTIAARYNVDSTCLANTNCNGGLNAYDTICIPTNCPYTAPTPAPTTQAPTTAAPAQNGFVNGYFYCNGYQATIVYPPNVQNCGGVYYTNGAVANGYVGSTFYCNGVASASSTGTCGGI
jgi:LysM repeat protein